MAQVGADQRAPVDRDRDPRPQHRRGLRRAARIEVPAADLRPPSRHRQQRDVEVASQPAHAVEEVRVAGEVDPQPGCCDHVPERVHARSELEPPALVDRGRGEDIRGADRGPVAGAELDRLVEAATPERPPAAARDHDRRLPADHPQRREVEMVVVHVGDQHPVDDRATSAPGCGAVAVDDPQQARAQHGVGEQPQSRQLEQHGRVTDERDARRAHAPRAQARRSRPPCEYALRSMMNASPTMNHSNP